MSRSMEDLLHGLLRASPTPVGPIADAGVRAVIDLAVAHRVVGPVVWALQSSSDAAATATDDADAYVAERFAATMAWCLHLEVRLLEIRRWFAEAGGVEFLVLKGAAAAHLDEEDPSQRSFADLDLLIRERDMDRALDTLQRHGARRRVPQYHRGFDRRFVKGVGLTCGDGIEIDVHRTLCVGALGWRVPLDDLFARPDHFVVGGERFAALRLEHRALHAAYHAVVGSPTPALHTLRDLARYLARHELCPDVLASEAQRWGGTTVLWSAVRALDEQLGPVPTAWAEWRSTFDPEPGDLDLIAASTHPSSSPIDWPMWREMSWPDRLAYGWGVVAPSRELLSSRGETRLARVRRGGSGLLERVTKAPRRRPYA